jgi:hypothetical protein
VQQVERLVGERKQLEGEKDRLAATVDKLEGIFIRKMGEMQRDKENNQDISNMH